MIEQCPVIFGIRAARGSQIFPWHAAWSGIGKPAIGVNAAIGRDFEILDLVPFGGLGISHAIEQASAINRLLRNTVHHGGGLHSSGFQQGRHRSEEHTSELQSLMRISYAVFCLNKKKE